MSVREFFNCSDWVDYYVLRPLSHIHPNWELTWDRMAKKYKPEDNSFAELLNELIDELASCPPPAKYHDNEDTLAEYVQQHLNWGIIKSGSTWLGRDGNRLRPDDYVVTLQQGGFHDVDQAELVRAAAGRIYAAIARDQTHFDEMEESHQYILSGVLSSILYHRA